MSHEDRQKPKNRFVERNWRAPYEKLKVEADPHGGRQLLREQPRAVCGELQRHRQSLVYGNMDCWT